MQWDDNYDYKHEKNEKKIIIIIIIIIVMELRIMEC